MTPTLACPDDPQLQRLCRRRAAPAEVEAFASHLEHCTACADRLDRALHGDTVIEAMRAHQTTVDAPADPAASLLVERLLRLRPDPSAASDSTQALGDAAAPNPPTADYAFLTPPQTADEIGRLGPYRVLSVLGSGGMGVVFRAEDVPLKRTVALKVMKPEAAAKPAARERFLREAQAAAAVEHEHVIAIYQVGEANGVPFLAMPWLKGTSLEELLRKNAVLPPAQVARIGRQVALGLAAAHERGLIHRDVKPANLWIEPSHGGHVRILDFGLARALADDVHLTQSGAILGTPAYMAPEQARGEKVDTRCDLFSLGVVLYRMATGRLPFRGDSTMAILTSLAIDAPAAPRQHNADLPAELADLILELMNKDPARRPAAAGVVAGRLEAIERRLAEPGAAAEPTEAPPPRPRAAAAPRWRRALPIAAVALLVLGSLGYVFGGAVMRFAVGQGELVVEVNDPAIEVAVKQDNVLVQDKTSGREFTLTAKNGEIEVYEKDGVHLLTKKFELTRGGKTTITVTAQELADARKPKEPPTPAPPGGDRDREVATWVLSIGGSVGVSDNGAEREVKAVADLPAGAWTLNFVNLTVNKQVTDADMKRLTGLQGLQRLYLTDTRVTDAALKDIAGLKSLRKLSLKSCSGATNLGVKELAGLQGLRQLDLSGIGITDAALKDLTGLQDLEVLDVHATGVTDAGMKDAAALQQLTTLYLGRTAVTDTGLKALTGLKLQLLDLNNTAVTDEGMKSLAGFEQLKWLRLTGTSVTGAGLRELAGLKSMQMLDLNGTGVTDAGLTALADMKFLYRLDLGGTHVTDTGLKHLAGLKGLQWLDLTGAGVTAAGVAELQKALPKCQIVSGPAGK